MLKVPAAALGEEPQQGCTVGEMQPLIKHAPGKKVERKRPPAGSASELDERLRLDASTTVTIVQAGCAHYGVLFHFDIAAQSATRAGTRVSTVLILLKKLAPHVETSVVEQMLKMLEKRKGEVIKPEDVIQDADVPDVTLTISQADVGKKRRVTVGYSFAL